MGLVVRGSFNDYRAVIILLLSCILFQIVGLTH